MQLNLLSIEKTTVVGLVSREVLVFLDKPLRDNMKNLAVILKC